MLCNFCCYYLIGGFGFISWKIWSFSSTYDTCGLCGDLGKRKNRKDDQKPLSLSFPRSPTSLQKEICRMGLLHKETCGDQSPCASCAFPSVRCALLRGTLLFLSELTGAAEGIESKVHAWHWFKNNSFWENTVIICTLSIDVTVEKPFC